MFNILAQTPNASLNSSSVNRNNMNQSRQSNLSNIDDNCRCLHTYMDRRPKLQLQSETTNKAFYKPLPLQKRKQFQMPKVQQKHYDPQALQTSYKNHYDHKKLQRNNNQSGMGTKSNVNLTQSYLKQKAKIPFYSDTQYKNTYKLHQVKIENAPKYQYKPKDTKFEGESSYKAQFGPKKPVSDLANVGSNIVNVKDYLNKKPNIPFQGSSSYKDTFQKYDVKPQKQPQFKYVPKDTKFEGASSYKDSYQAPSKDVYKSGIEYCPIHPDKIAMK